MKELIIFLTFCAAGIIAIAIVFDQFIKDDEAQRNNNDTRIS